MSAADSPPSAAVSRPVGGTEYSWCRAVPGGTGVTVLALLFSKPPNLSHLQACIHKLQDCHPILRSKLRFDPSANAFSLLTPPSPSALQIQTSDAASDSFYLTLEREMNTNAWRINDDQVTETEVMFASFYVLPDQKWSVVLRLHTAVCDRASAASLLRELLGLFGDEGGGEREVVKENGVGLAIEDCVPAGKANKPFWARGVDMLGYSVNSFRFSNLDFKEAGKPNSTQFVRFNIGVEDTDRILSRAGTQTLSRLLLDPLLSVGIYWFGCWLLLLSAFRRHTLGCKSREIKLYAVLAAAVFIAAHASKNLPEDKWEKYSLAALIDCRPLLDPVLSDHHIGFYHSAVMNSHDVKGKEDLWDLAQRVHTSLETAKNSNKHFTDMADLNFLMLKAIDNPGLTQSSSLRTSLISVFEDAISQNTEQFYKDIGLLDCIGCASVHGVSPSVAIFDVIHDGELDCVCVYPSPTHSREQMQDFVDHIKKVLIGSVQ